ncbi:MAG: hypothetical protein ISR65_17340 [Bacteriovoracaceae bacterium]|nr:hypothetical protein [Bacteriovoracaceae bacterium]
MSKAKKLTELKEIEGGLAHSSDSLVQIDKFKREALWDIDKKTSRYKHLVMENERVIGVLTNKKEAAQQELDKLEARVKLLEQDYSDQNKKMQTLFLEEQKAKSETSKKRIENERLLEELNIDLKQRRFEYDNLQKDYEYQKRQLKEKFEREKRETIEISKDFELLKNKREQLKEQIEDIELRRIDKRALDKEINELWGQKEKIGNDVSKLEHKKQELNEELIKFKTRLEDQSSELKNQIDCLKDKKLETECEIEHFLSVRKEIDDQNTRKKEEVENLTQQLRKIKADIDDVHKLTEDVRKIKEEKSKVSLDLEIARKNELEKIEQLNRLEKKSNEAVDLIEDYKSELVTLEYDKKKKESEIEDYKNNLLRQKEKVENYRSEIAKEQNKHQEILKTQQDEQLELEKLIMKKKDLESGMKYFEEVHKKQKEDLEFEIKCLQDKDAVKREKVALLNTTIGELGRKLDELEDNKNYCDRAVQKITEEITELNSTKERMKDDIANAESYRQDVKQLEDKKYQMISNLEDLQSKKKRLEEEVDTIYNNRKKLDLEIEKMDEQTLEIERIKISITNEIEKENECKQRLKDLEKQKHEAGLSLEKMHKEYQSEQEKLQLLKDEQVEMQNKKEKEDYEIKELERKKIQLKMELEAFISRRSEIDVEISKMNEQVAQIKIINEQLVLDEQKAKLCAEEITKLMAQKSEVTASVDSIRKEYLQEHKKLASLKEDSSQLLDKKDTLSYELKQLHREKDELAEEIGEVSEKLVKNNEKLEIETKNMTTKIDQMNEEFRIQQGQTQEQKIQFDKIISEKVSIQKESEDLMAQKSKMEHTIKWLTEEHDRMNEIVERVTSQKIALESSLQADQQNKKEIEADITKRYEMQMELRAEENKIKVQIEQAHKFKKDVERLEKDRREFQRTRDEYEKNKQQQQMEFAQKMLQQAQEEEKIKRSAVLKENIIRYGKYSIPVLAIALLITIVKTEVYQDYLKQQNPSASIDTSTVGSNTYTRKIAPAYSPTQTWDYKNSYVENVIYTKGFVKMKLDQQYHERWVVALNDLFIKKFNFAEEKIIEFISLENEFIKKLMKMHERIKPLQKNEGVAQMKSFEQEFVADLARVFRKKENFRNFKEFEKRFYNNFKESISQD